jgi:predicted nucleotidyltransferase
VKVTFPARDREQIVLHLRERMLALAQDLPIRRVVLFGSWARGRATAFSDVDVLVVYAGPSREDAYRLAWRALDLPGLEPHVYAEAEAVALAATLDQMTRDSVPIFDAD